jgi:hypothetical protein
MEFQLINMFQDYYFAFFTNGTQHPELGVLSKTVVKFAHPNVPLQGHLSLTDDPAHMRYKA